MMIAMTVLALAGAAWAGYALYREFVDGGEKMLECSEDVEER